MHTSVTEVVAEFGCGNPILNGATPADLPVEKALGITIPPHLLTPAEEVISSQSPD
jgi:hypothetical protein